MDKDLIQKLKNHWRNINAATIGFAQSIPANKWHSKTFDNRFKSFSWEFACLTRTRMCYTKGLKTGELIFSTQKEVPNKEVVEKWGKTKVVNELKKLAKEILTLIGKVDSPNQVDMIIWLLEHERIHHGKLTLYHSKANFKLPESFKNTWGKNNFP